MTKTFENSGSEKEFWTSIAEKKWISTLSLSDR